ncbi:PhzF family phenazine biosynthesis protein [Fusibacter ferrireducens]|uniref:PhzF family phenazine biosynthesis protein n=1 Tax=Fusibacter ferrireducens TaxID=2785058 RepID=A0ABR9ZP69_9FIRM|nr:PhzF family phenazine biosynthesis protein [Fusibacter ferrireducens]MBF4692252.1 PhzF family phenazine biosynthesis protein [Fusibacter ferrireducens]
MKQYVVDAFTDKVFGGNPAAVCVMDSWLSDELMLNITKENNLSETAFAVKEGDNYRLRWFTPGGEIDLCGHATLATAYVITRFVEPDIITINFDTLSGILNVEKKGDLFEMDFPAYDLKKVDVTEEMVEAMEGRPLEAYLGRDLLCVLNSEQEVRNLTVDEEKAKALEGLLVHVTAKGKDFDCVSRSFAPKLNVSEDPVCGSGHCHIIPYWGGKLEKNELVAYQASERGGTLYCRLENDRVKLSGKAALYSVSDIFIE